MFIRNCLTIGIVTTTLFAAEYGPKWEARGADLGTGVTYQGQLKENGVPVTATLPMTFTLHDDPLAGALLGTVGPINVSVSTGLFTTELDFGAAAFNGQARWLEINVNGQPLSPRQKLSPAPHALALPGLYSQQNGISPNLIGGYNANVIATSTGGAVTGGTIGGGGSSGIGINRVTDNYSTVGGGANNRAGDNNNSATNKSYATVAGGRSNTAGGAYSTVGGGQQQNITAEYGTIAGGGPSDPADSTNTNNRVTDNYGTIAGGGNNRAGDGAGSSTDRTYATVGGGEGNVANGSHCVIAGGHSNVASASFSGVGGGLGNQATGSNAVVAGGEGNVASGPYAFVGGGGNLMLGSNTASGHASVIAGGYANQATHNSTTVGGGQQNTAIGREATVAGGSGNTASGESSAVIGGTINSATGVGSASLGGSNNTAEGQYSAVVGGRSNRASGDYSIAAGRRAKVRDPNEANSAGGDFGTFVWADSTDADFSSSGFNQFLVRASGGVGINKNNPQSGALDVAGNTIVEGNVRVVGTGASSQSPFVITRTAIPSDTETGLALGVVSNGYRWIQSYDGQPLVLNPIANNVGIGRAATSNKLEVEGNASKTTAGSWMANSDARIKTDVRPVTGALEKLERVRLVEFRYTEQYRAQHPSVENRGYLNVVAQEFAKVFPEYVRASGEKLEDSGDILQVDTYPLTIYSAAAVQELHEQVREKNREIAELKARLERIERFLAEDAAPNRGVDR